MRALRTVLSICLMMLISSATGCMTSVDRIGRPIDEAKIQQIVKGKTTMEDVIAMFGTPQDNFQMGENTLYVYRYTENKQSMLAMPYSTSSKGNSTSDELSITFDKSGLVKAYSYQVGIGKK